VDSAIRRFVVGLNLDDSIEPGLKKAAARARLIPLQILPLLIATGAGFYWGGGATAAAIATCGILSLLAFYLLTKAALASTQRQLIDKLDASSSQLHELLTRHVTEDVESAFGHFMGLLTPAAETTQKREKELESQTHSLADLGKRFDHLQQRLHSLPARC
jgi:hypothetical protein